MSHLSPEQLDTIRELVNIGVGRAAAILNQMTQVHVRLDVPFVQVIARHDLRDDVVGVDETAVAGVHLGFKGAFSGTAALVFPPSSASNLVATLIGDETLDEDLDALRIGTLTEVGNIVLNGVLGTFTNMLKQSVKYSVPTFYEGPAAQLVLPGEEPEEGIVLLARIFFDLEQLLVNGNIVLLFEVASSEVIAQAISAMAGEDM